METRTQRVVLQTPSHEIIGDLTMPREGYRSRLSDFLNRGDVNFIPLVDAQITQRNGAVNGKGESITRSFIAVARDHVQLAYPASE
ncbi:MAG TPA: hypothetical protein VKA36_04995 [Solirubrobacterales bacterium]|nr:hypothetical protein [Solirubrobacterales bacterium]